MRAIENLGDVQIVLRQLLDTQDKLRNHGTDLNGLRTRNASDAVLPGDYVTLRQLQLQLDQITTLKNEIASLKQAAAAASTNPTLPASSTSPVSKKGTTPPPPVTSPTGPPTVTSLPNGPSSTLGNQVIFNGTLYQFVGASQFAGIAGFWEPVVSTPPVLQDTHVNRLAHFVASSYPDGTTFFETDRTSIYIVQGGVWVWYSGAMNGPLAALPTDLNTNDINFRFQATDYKHLYKWNGTVWAFDPDDVGSGFTVFAGPGFFIADGLWGLCDGSIYTIAQSDGSLVTSPSPIIANTYIRR